jgi:hypothetical protein
MDNWVVACGGTEPVMSIGARRVQLMWNRATNERSYYDHSRDIFLEHDDLVSLGLSV